MAFTEAYLGTGQSLESRQSHGTQLPLAQKTHGFNTGGRGRGRVDRNRNIARVCVRAREGGERERETLQVSFIQQSHHVNIYIYNKCILRGEYVNETEREGERK